jgi:RimJ/RimL family protein N-acetyltransferase
MTRAVYTIESDPDAAFEFVNRINPVNASSWQKGIVQRRDGEVIAACLFHEHNGSNLFMHIAGTPGTNWLTRDMLWNCFHYPFVQLGCKRVTGWIEADNVRSRRFAERTGWTNEARLEKAGRDGVDVIIYRMFREDCRYV